MGDFAKSQFLQKYEMPYFIEKEERAAGSPLTAQELVLVQFSQWCQLFIVFVLTNINLF